MTPFSLLSLFRLASRIASRLSITFGFARILQKAKLTWNNLHAKIDHCLEYWREAAMCRGDTALGTFRWVDDLPYSRVYSDHECVDWQRLDAWARGRMVNMSDYSQFLH